MVTYTAKKFYFLHCHCLWREEIYAPSHCSFNFNFVHSRDASFPFTIQKSYYSQVQLSRQRDRMGLHSPITQHKSKRQKNAAKEERHVTYRESKAEDRKLDCPMKLEETMSKSPDNLRIDSISNDLITTSTVSPTWKLYENPFYTNSSTAPQYPSQNHIHQARPSEGNKSCDHQPKQIHRLQLPISTRKIAASFWDLSFIRPFMESELELARAKLLKLKAELEQERKARKKAESINKKLVRELSEARKGRESLERLCEELAREISSHKAEMDRMNKDMEEERKMLRMAEVLREERVQMKLAEAKLLLEEKLYMCGLELEGSKCCKTEAKSETVAVDIPNVKDGKQTKTASNGGTGTNSNHNHHSSGSGDEMKSAPNNDRNGSNIGFGYIPSPSASGSQRRASPEPENPHIRRGIKGFVEFPRVVRAIG